ncbi:MAG: hypothetical protein V3S69_06040 [Dehalococcoidales bacterium]
MNYDSAKKVIERLNPRVILVSGPQRSGTTIAARIIQKDFDRTYIDENDYGVHNFENVERRVAAEGKQYVIQGPGLSSFLHKIDPDWLGIFMWRSKEEILASQKRIEWHPSEPSELGKYNDRFGAKEVEKYGKIPISDLKKMFWTDLQQFKLGERGITLSYKSLKSHPLWVDKEDRTGTWGVRTYRPGG